MTRQTNLPDQAAAYFRRGYNCAQSILLTMQQHYNIRPNPLIPKIATALGGGIGLCGNVCGAFTGATLAIGLRYGTNRPSHKSREKAYAQTQTLHEQFTKTFGTLLCRELIDYDLTNPVELEKARKLQIFDKKCAEIVKKTVEMLLNLDR